MPHSTLPNTLVKGSASQVPSSQRILQNNVQRSAKVFVRGCEKFVIALAYLFCLALVGSCLARFTYFLADLCTIVDCAVARERVLSVRRPYHYFLKLYLRVWHLREVNKTSDGLHK